MDKKLVRNYIYNILYQRVKIILPLVIIPYTYAHLTPAVVGISDYAGSIMQWFVLFGILGVNTYGNREIAKVRNDRDKLNRTFFEILYMQMADMVIAATAYYIFISFAITENLTIFRLTGFTMLASMLDISWFFYGVEDFKKASIRNIVVKCLGTGLIFLLCKTPADLWKFVLINAGSELFGQFIMFFQLKQYITFEKVSLADAYRHHFKPTFQLFIPTIAISVYTMLDRTMVGALYNEEHLSYYKTSIGFVQMFLYFITSIGAVVLPRITNVFYNEEGGEEKAKNLIKTTMKIALMLSVPMCLGMVAVAGNFISWYLPTAPIVADLIRFGSPIIIFISMSNVTGIQYLVPTGMYTQYTISVVTGSVVNFIINSLLIPRYGAYGAITGSVIAEFCVTCVQLAFVYRKAHIRFFDRSYVIYVIGAAVMMAAVMAVVRVLPVNIAGTVLSIFAGMIVYFIILYVSKEDLCMKVMGMIRRRKANA